MAYSSGDTIVAISTATGSGGIGIVRLSGPKALQIAERITLKKPTPRYALLCDFKNQEGINIDKGILLYFKAPHSFTGEDITEFQAHGGPVLLNSILKACCYYGARLAEPGEFSLRAFLNKKLDLAQAEGLADLIGASTERAAISAANSFQGKFSEGLEEISSKLLDLRILVEASLDFPEEEINFLEEENIKLKLSELVETLFILKKKAREGTILRDGINLVLAGNPNVGKSSLLNTLTARNRAIVSSVPGTTRDTIEEMVELDGIPIKIIDTAGLRKTDNPVEQEGISRTIAAISKADEALIIFDVSITPGNVVKDPEYLLNQFPEIPWKIKKTIIMNKSDLTDIPAGEMKERGYTIFHVSAVTGDGIPQLKKHLTNKFSSDTDCGDSSITARTRHIDALEKCLNQLKQASKTFIETGASELLAEDLKSCMDHLGQITGETCSEKLLGEIFSKFCIGK